VIRCRSVLLSGSQLAVLALLDDRRFVEPPVDHLIGIELGEAWRGDRFLRQYPAQIARHGHGLVADVALRLLVIAARQLVGVLEQAARAVREPELDA
jgi:hypothetical protein